LLKRSENHDPWYELHRPRSFLLVKKPKLLSGWRKGDSQFSIETTGKIFYKHSGRTAAIVTKDGAPSLKSLLGVLNSSIIKLYVHTISPEFQGLGHVYEVKILDNIPVVPLTEKSKPLYDAVAKGVKEILALQPGKKSKEIVKRQAQLESDR